MKLKLPFAGAFLLLAGWAAAQTPIKVLNPGFADGTNPAATSWTAVNGGGTNSAPSNYAEAVPNIGSRSFQIKSDGGNYIQQPLTLTAADAPIDASSFGTWSVSLLRGYRRDAVRNGDHTLRVSLWNTTTDSELAGSDFTIADPGSTGPNSLSPVTVVVNYDESVPALSGAGVALRITSLSGDLGGNSWQRTAILDDVSVVGGVIDPALTLDPVPVFSNSGAPSVLTLGFSNTGASQNLVVSGVTLGGADAASFAVNSFTPSLAPGAAGQIQLGFTPVGNGPYTAEITIASNATGTPSIVVPVTVNVVDPVLVASSARIDFGNLAVNPGAQTANLAITNNGGATDLEIFDAQFLGTGGNGFTIISLPAEPIIPGGSANIVVGFNPGTMATGHFGDLLRVESNAANTPVLLVPVVAQVAFTAAATPVTIVNGDFNAAGWNSATGTSPAGWTSSKAAASATGNYGQSAPATPNLTSIAAHFWASAGYYEQNLSDNNAGLTAAGSGVVSVTFDHAYRNDTFTRGDILLRVAIWDTTNGVEITGRELMIEDNGVQAGGASNQLVPVSFRLNYDPSLHGAGDLALRITQLEPQITVNAFEATAIIDNVTVATSGTWTGPVDPFATWALANGLDGTPGKESSAADDPDKDGTTNFDEYAFAGNPLSGGSNGLVAVSTVDTTADSQRELVITFAVRAGASFSGSPSPAASIDGIDYAVQGSLDLSLFTATVEGPLAATVIPPSFPASPPAGYDYVSFRLGGSNGLPGKGFLRAVAVP